MPPATLLKEASTSPGLELSFVWLTGWDWGGLRSSGNAPTLRYEFADARLETASAGQKLMMRVGAPNESRLKAKLRELRSEIVRQAIE